MLLHKSHSLHGLVANGTVSFLTSNLKTRAEFYNVDLPTAAEEGCPRPLNRTATNNLKC